MKFLYLARVGPIDSKVLEVLSDCVSRSFGFPARLLGDFQEPDYAYEAARRQYSSTAILRELVPAVPADAVRLLGVTARDIFIPMLSFIYGQAQLGGTAALVSLARLDQQFYGLPPNPPLLKARARKEALHELGHTFNLVHCPDRACVMALSTNIRQVDLKQEAFCRGCAALLLEHAKELTTDEHR